MKNPRDGGASALHVLIVDDDDLVGETIMAMLDGACQPTLASDSMTAMDILNSGTRVDVVILDCLMPGGGPSRLLAVTDTMGIPVIMTSGSSAEIERIGGSRPSLAKPFSAEQMIELLHRVVAAR